MDDYLRKQIADAELELADIAMGLEFSMGMEVLLTSDAWKVLAKRIDKILDDETKKIRCARMDEYELGRRQGRLAVLQYMARQRPQSPDELVALKERAVEVQARLAELQREAR